MSEKAWGVDFGQTTCTSLQPSNLHEPSPEQPARAFHRASGKQQLCNGSVRQVDWNKRGPSLGTGQFSRKKMSQNVTAISNPIFGLSVLRLAARFQQAPLPPPV